MNVTRRTDMAFDAAAYDAWFETPLGCLCGDLEKVAILRLANVKRGESVLDLGCGTGIYSLELARRGAKVVGIDSSTEMLATAEAKAHREKLPVKFHWARADSLPFTPASFDLVISVTALCFADRPDSILREANRLLKSSGRIVIGELNRLSYWSLLRRFKGLFRESSYRQARFLSLADLRRLLWREGFLVKKSGTLIYFPPTNWRPVLKQYRLFERAGGVLFPGLGAFMGIEALKQGEKNEC